MSLDVEGHLSNGSARTIGTVAQDTYHKVIKRILEVSINVLKLFRILVRYEKSFPLSLIRNHGLHLYKDAIQCSISE
jgi:hypothetical protein